MQNKLADSAFGAAMLNKALEKIDALIVPPPEWVSRKAIAGEQATPTIVAEAMIREPIDEQTPP